MNKNEKLVWKLIDRQISEQEFQELQGALLQDRELRRYYQNCLETYAVLSSHLSPKTEEIAFPKFEKRKWLKTPFVLWSGWAAAVFVFCFFFTSEKEPKVSLASAENADWRGFAPATGDIVPQKTLHLQNGTVKLSFPSQTTVSISGPAYFQVVDHRTLEVFDGNVVINHQGKPGEFSLLTPIGELKDLGTRFRASIRNQKEDTRVATEVLEGKVEFSAKGKAKRIFETGESATIVGRTTSSTIVIHPGSFRDEGTPPQPDLPFQETDQLNEVAASQKEIKATDIILAGNLKAQINYSIIESIAESIDEKTQILEKAETSFQPVGEIEFAEAAMPEIEAMAHSIVEGCVDFSKISLWAASKTAEVAWIENKNEKGDVISRMPYANRLDEPMEGNRLLFNLKKVRSWLQSVHQLHEEKGMGWVSSFGCPEDGKLIFENRNKKIFAIDRAIASIESNLE